MEFTLIERQESHARLLLEWRNDPDTLNNSFRQERKTFEQFWPQFLFEYFLLPDLPSLFGVVDGQKVASARFRPTLVPHGGRAAEISMVVDPKQRGKGIGSMLLKRLAPVLATQGYEAIYAEIKPENAASKRIFTKAGYVFVGNSTHTIASDAEFLVEIYELRLLPPRPARCFVIAEVGSNWRAGSPQADRERARRLIEMAKEAGCDAVKFQTYRAASVYAPGAGSPDYLQAMGIETSMQELFAGLEMPYEMLGELAVMCQEVGIELMSTPFGVGDFEAIDPHVQRHKIASYEIGHLRLLEAVGRTGKPVILSTGASTIMDIVWALDVLRRNGCGPVTLLQCTAQYPAAPVAMNLAAIPWMQGYFQLPVGLSDHSLDPFSAPLAAVALGATVIEKHVTLQRSLPGPDHAFAVEPGELVAMVRHIREAESMLGQRVKGVAAEEQKLQRFAKRAVQALMPIRKGELFVEGHNVAILRPGNQPVGVHPRYMPGVEGRTALRDLKAGEGVQLGDWG